MCFERHGGGCLQVRKPPFENGRKPPKSTGGDTNRLNILDSATPYTYQRYSPPRGSAYGLKIKIAESRLAGRLPVQNCYALGHHAIMPGILGTMLGAFLTFRQAVGEEAYKKLIRQEL